MHPSDNTELTPRTLRQASAGKWRAPSALPRDVVLKKQLKKRNGAFKMAISLEHMRKKKRLLFARKGAA
jgi:hypothetical protein